MQSSPNLKVNNIVQNIKERADARIQPGFKIKLMPIQMTDDSKRQDSKTRAFRSIDLNRNSDNLNATKKVFIKDFNKVIVLKQDKIKFNKNNKENISKVHPVQQIPFRMI